MSTDAAPPPHIEGSFHGDSPAKSTRWIGVGVFLAGCMAAAIFAFIIYPRQGVIETNLDVNAYGALGRSVYRGEGFSEFGGPTIRRAPLYPYFVALLLHLFQHNPDPHLPEHLFYRPVLVAHCLLVGFNCLTVWTLGRKLFTPRVGLLAVSLCLISPMVMRYVGVVEVETLFSLLITLTALTGYNLYLRQTPVNCILFAVTCALATLTKSVALLYPLLFLISLSYINSKSSFKRVQTQNSLPQNQAHMLNISLRACSILVILSFGLCLLPWALRNYAVSAGQFKNISSNGPAEFLRGYLNAQPKFYLLRQDFGGTDTSRLSWEQEASNYEVALLRPYGLDFANFERGVPHDPQLLALPVLDYQLRKETIEAREMKNRLLHEPGRFLHKCVVQLATFWYIVETRKKSLMIGIIALVTLSFALFGWRRARASNPGVFAVALPVIYFNVIYAVFLSFARYSMPLYPVILIFTAFGIGQAWKLRLRYGKV